ncbi:hypothetical protein FCM35_KLT00419 [Carex littledalei]|uniref:Uncharacterized protein n=1 Tax=Carex littledalei TaxID=544730 RepID=A0A833RU08_9POAL|nr:hypothetical protein FCM35_KLT00419 [Carex littledalei]
MILPQENLTRHGNKNIDLMVISRSPSQLSNTQAASTSPSLALALSHTLGADKFFPTLPLPAVLSGQPRSYPFSRNRWIPLSPKTPEHPGSEWSAKHISESALVEETSATDENITKIIC